MQQIIDFRSRPPFGNFVHDWIFRLDDVPGNPGLKSKFQKMEMDLPNSLLQQSMDEFFVENERCGIIHSIIPMRILPNQNNNDLVELLTKWPDKFTGFAGLRPYEDGREQALADIQNLFVTDRVWEFIWNQGLTRIHGSLMMSIYFLFMNFAKKKIFPYIFFMEEFFIKAMHLITAFIPLHALKNWQELFQVYAYCFLMPAGHGQRMRVLWP